MKIELYANKRMVRPLVWLTAVLLIIVACGGNNEQSDPLAPIADSGVLACTEECSRRGQCGTVGDGSSVVLVSTHGPATDGHELIFPDNSAVTVLASEVHTLQPILGGDPFDLPFYLISNADQSRGGWVASWCVLPP